jgi:chromosome segregation ATPase
MKARFPALAFACALAFGFAAAPAIAADKKPDPAKEQVRRLQQMSRKLEQEKAQLAQEKAAAESKVKESEDRLGEARRKIAGANHRTAELEKQLETLRAEKDALAGKLADTEKQLADTTGRYRTTEAERKGLEALAAQQKQSIATCEEKNVKMHGEGVALLERYQAKSCADAFLQSEPFTGFKKVEIENFVEDAREKFDEHKLEERKPDRQTQR